MMCAIGGTLDVGVNLRPDKYPNGIKDPDRSFGRESRCLKASFELVQVGGFGRRRGTGERPLRSLLFYFLSAAAAGSAADDGSCGVRRTAGTAATLSTWQEASSSGGTRACRSPSRTGSDGTMGERKSLLGLTDGSEEVIRETRERGAQQPQLRGLRQRSCLACIFEVEAGAPLCVL